MKPRQIILIVVAFVFIVFATIIFVRWLNPPPVIPAEYKKQMETYNGQIKLLLEDKRNQDRIILMADKVLRLYDQTQQVYKSALSRNDIQIKLVQQDYEKNNRFDTAGSTELLRYVAEYKSNDRPY